MTLIAISQIIISIFVAYIACQQFIVNRDKLRLDLYNKRFEIYNKIIELYIQIPEPDSIYKIQEEFNKNKLNEFKELNHGFTKYLRESKFLFDEELDIHSKIRDIHNEFSNITKNILVIVDIKKPENTLSESEEIVTTQNKTIELIKKLQNDMLELEKSLKPYLYFPSV